MYSKLKNVYKTSQKTTQRTCREKLLLKLVPGAYIKKTNDWYNKCTSHCSQGKII